ncbi:helix-turn-helix transcriptional regulator [Agromyces humatus]|uniref:Helix-turn-helix domain-containing protein n=1 Tax=Agromyces humatus TaxID=279573 RepID=A0ABN2L240_9MICO|nr:helix-turn-helix domain-containing protein [Agromyces humatus]
MATDESGYEDDLIAVRVLGDPTRRRVYTAVARSAEPVSRDHVATLLAIPRSTAAFHLERLADAGLLAVEFRRLTGRTGPGSGRPAKVYVRPEAELSVSVPRRHYELAGEVMAEAIGRAVGGDVPVRDALHEAALRGGRRLAGASADLDDALERAGLEPRIDGDDTVLGTCPFHRLARGNPGVVCELNHAMLCGMAEAVGDDPGRVHLDAGAGGCCIRISPAP